MRQCLRRAIAINCLLPVQWIFTCDTYTARQFYGIAPLVLTACLTAGVNLCHCQYNAPGNNYLLWPSDKCYVHPSLLFCPGQPFFLGVRISPIATKVVWRICVDHIQLWAVAVCKLPSQNKLPIILTNIRQVLENIVPFLGLSKRVFS